jgi:predicted TIM-barrel fold metal-dependent hydrolase
MGPAGGFSNQAQFIPNLIFSGVLDRYPRLRWVCAETGIGWVNYMLEACDHEWERRHLWTQGIVTRPSELFKRQIHVDFWYETAGIELRHVIGLDNIMWESDYPHSTSTYPESWQFVERTLKGVPQEERNQLLYGNAMRIYNLA